MRTSQENRQETRTPGLNFRQEKRSPRKNAKCRGNAKEKRAHLRLIDGASDSVGNHVVISNEWVSGEAKSCMLGTCGEPGFLFVSAF